MRSIGLQQEALLSEKEAAARLGISRITLLRMRAANRISFFRIGTRVLFSEDHLRTFLEGVERKAGESRKVR
jgi:excisionase family DNA binding protein